MSIHVTYSNRAEELLVALAGDLDAGKPASPLTPVDVLVPNRAVETWVKLELARVRGVAANLRFERLAAWLAGVTGEEKAPASEEAVAGALLAIFLDDKKVKRPAMAPVRVYLADGEVGVDRRRVQLATELARFFDGYAQTREDMVAQWRAGKGVLKPGPQKDVEAWQRALWLDLYEPGKGALVAEGRPASLGDAYAALDLRALALPAHVYLFGFSYMAETYRTILGRIAGRCDVHVYAVHASEALAVASPTPSPLLEQWGGPGREGLAPWKTATARPVDPLGKGGAPTLLRQLQRDLLVSEPARTSTPAAFAGFATDRSLRVLRCPSPRRELEVVADEIWALVRTTPGLRFSDVAVLVAGADKDAYLAHVPAVFAAAHDLPHTISDLALTAGSRLTEAVKLLLALPGSSFARADLLRFVTHPTVAARAPDADVDQWAAWIDALGVFHGADRADHAGTYIQKDVIHWDQGLRRLALGAVMAGARSGDARTVALGGATYEPEEVSSSQLDGAGALGLLVRSLVADARFCAQAKLSFTQWAAVLASFVKAYVRPRDDDERRELSRCLGVIGRLAGRDLGGATVSYTVVAESVTAGLGTLAGSRGQYLADGVAVSALAPMRPVPFKDIFVVGLNEGAFPARDARDLMDLRQAEPRPGDVGPRARDRYAFLETLLSARERLVLSYVARDPLTGDELQPSSVVVELLDVLERGYAPRKSLVEDHPLHRHDEKAADTPASQAERAAGALGEALRKAAGKKALPELRALEGVVPAAAWASMRQLLGVLSAPAPTGAREALNVSLSALRRFLECPLQGSASFVLGLREDDDEDRVADSDEPFGSDFLEELMLLRATVIEAAREGRDPHVILARRAEELERRGRHPTGLLAECAGKQQLENLEAWTKHIPGANPSGRKLPKVEVVRFGAGDEHDDSDVRLDALQLAVPVKLPAGGTHVMKVAITGRTEPLLAGRTESLVLRPRNLSNNEEAQKQQKDALRAFLDHVALSAHGNARKAGARHVAHVIRRDGGVRAELKPMSQTDARRYLTALVGDMFTGVHDYLLPCEAVFTQKVKGFDLEEIVDNYLATPLLSFSSKYGPIKDLERFAVPDPARASAMIASRFSPYFDRQVNW